MIKIDRAVVVEGKYDKIKLQNIADAVIITTDGFGVFRNENKKRLIKRIAEEKGLAVITDSDNAGNMIRAYVKKICSNADIVNVYIPQIKGKERRKSGYSSEGFLGVEGLDDDILLSALERAGVAAQRVPSAEPKITTQTLYKHGFSGGQNSRAMRRAFCIYADLPDNLSTSAFLDAVNTFYTLAQFEERVIKWRQEADKK